VIVAILVLIVVMNAIQTGKLGSPFESPKSGTLSVTVRNDDWLDGRDYRIYIDGDLFKEDHVGASAHETWDFTVFWYGDSIHSCDVKVVSEGKTVTKTVYLEADGQASTTMTL